MVDEKSGRSVCCYWLLLSAAFAKAPALGDELAKLMLVRSRAPAGERGSRAELAAQGSVYARLTALQFTP